MPRRRKASGLFDALEVEDVYHIDDEDGDTTSDTDLCETCYCPRHEHKNGKGACTMCKKCKRFNDP